MVSYVVLVVMAGCSDGGRDHPDSSSSAASVEDLSGRTVSLQVPATRIVSLVPSATLILGAVGAGDRLVGRTDFDTMTWAMGLRSVGTGIHPSYEFLAALRPDLVIRFAGPQDTRTPTILDRLRIPHVAVRHDSIDDILRVITLLGEVAGADAAARELRVGIERALARTAEEASRHEAVRVAYVLGGSVPMVAGPGNFINEILTTAGGVNAFADVARSYAQVSPEEFVARRIDVILARDASHVPPGVVRDARVVAVGDLLEFPGPGVGEAAQTVERLLHHDSG